MGIKYKHTIYIQCASWTAGESHSVEDPEYRPLWDSFLIEKNRK